MMMDAVLFATRKRIFGHFMYRSTKFENSYFTVEPSQ